MRRQAADLRTYANKMTYALKSYTSLSSYETQRYDGASLNTGDAKSPPTRSIVRHHTAPEQQSSSPEILSNEVAMSNIVRACSNEVNMKPCSKEAAN